MNVLSRQDFISIHATVRSATHSGSRPYPRLRRASLASGYVLGGEHSAGHVDLVGAVLRLIISCRILALCALPQIATTE